MNIKYIILEQIITEGRLEDMIKKYKDKLSEILVRQLSDGDPSGNNKYLDWMCAQRKDYTSEYIIEMVKCFHENVNRLSEKNIVAAFVGQENSSWYNLVKSNPKDINSYESPELIALICKYFDELKPMTTADRIKIWSDGRWELISPLTHKASCKYGIHSNWCVSTSNPDYFNRYTKDGVLIFWLDKKELHPVRGQEIGNYKIAVHIKFSNFDKPEKWTWYSMEDEILQSTFMLTILPKDGIEACKKYVNDILRLKNSEIFKKLDTIRPYTMGLVHADGEFFIFPNMVDGVISEKTISFFEQVPTLSRYLNRYQDNRDFGVPFFMVRLEDFTNNTEDFLNNFDWDDLSYHFIDDLESNGIIKKSDIINRINLDIHTANLDDNAKKQILYKLVKDFYNIMGDEPRRRSTPTAQLKIGDNIEFKERGKWTRGEIVKVTRILPKTIELSNGRKIIRSGTNSKILVLPPIKFVDDTINEQKWIRKRII